jgi:hypothetical protein
VRGLDLAYSQRSGNPLRQILQQLLLLDRRHIDEHDGARLEQHRHAAARSAKGQWVGRKRVLAFQPLDVETFPDLQRAHDHAGRRHWPSRLSGGRQRSVGSMQQ